MLELGRFITWCCVNHSSVEICDVLVQRYTITLLVSYQHTHSLLLVIHCGWFRFLSWCSWLHDQREYYYGSLWKWCTLSLSTMGWHCGLELITLTLQTVNVTVDLESDHIELPVSKKPTEFFTGCGTYLEKLKSHFLVHNKSASRKLLPRKLLLLHGVGGVGKTQICLKFIQEFRNK